MMIGLSVSSAIGRLSVLKITRRFDMGFLQVAAEVDKNGDRNAHDDQGTDAQDQEPPDHPHSWLG